MRSNHSPSRERASRKLPTAATSEPKCKGPVGEGAKRPRYGIVFMNLKQKNRQRAGFFVDSV
jgi:hypothetical protein